MEIIQENGGVGIVLPKSFSRPEAQELNRIIRGEMEKERAAFVIDAAGLEFIDSMGIGLLVTIMRDLQKTGGILRVRNLHGAPLELFKDTGLDEIFAVETGTTGKSHADGLETEDLSDLEMGVRIESRGEVAVFHFSGILSSDKAGRAIKERMLLALESRKKILLDFEDLTSFDETTIREIVNIRKLLVTSNGEMRLSNAGMLIDDLVEKLSAETPVACFSTIHEALTDWQ